MKKIIVVIAIAISSAASAQIKNNAQLKKDTVTALTDTTEFISIRDLNRLSAPYADRTTGTQWEAFKAIFNSVIRDAIAEWNKKHQPTKK